MPPPMSRRSAVWSRLSMTPSLSDTFAPPSTTAYGRSGSSVRRLSTPDLGLDEAADGGRQQPRDVVDAGLLAVHDAEPVGDEHVGETGELAGELGRAPRRSLAVSPGLKRRFSSSTTSPSCGRLDRGLGADSPTVSVAKRDVAAEHLAEARARRGPGSTSSSGAPLGRPRWAHTMTRAPASDRAWIVGADARMRPSSVMVCAVERHVEVGPDEDALAAQVAQLGDGLHADGAFRAQSDWPTSSVRSTRRLE